MPDDIKACPDAPACLGGTAVGDGSCANGTKGPLCAVCGPDFYMIEQTGECISCGSAGRPLLAALILLLMVLVGTSRSDFRTWPIMAAVPPRPCAHVHVHGRPATIVARRIVPK